MTQNARLFVFAAPSGAGKTTLVNMIVDRLPAIEFSVSYTTSAARDTEVEGKDYYFVDVETFAITARLNTPNLSHANLSPDASLLAAGAELGEVIIWDMKTGQRRHTLKGHEHWGYHISFSPSGLRLASAGGCRTIRIWSVETGRQERMLGPFRDHPSALSFHGDDRTLFSGHGGGRAPIEARPHE